MKKILIPALLLTALSGCGTTAGTAQQSPVSFGANVTSASTQTPGTGSAWQQLPDDACLAVFYHMMDTTNNYHVSQGEFAKSILAVWAPARETFQAMDSNNDGAMALGELQSDYKKQYAYQKGFFVATDTSRDGKVTYDEMLKSPLWSPFTWQPGEKEKLARSVMDSHDKDKNGTLNFTEFRPIFGWQVGCFKQADGTENNKFKLVLENGKTT